MFFFLKLTDKAKPIYQWNWYEHNLRNLKPMEKVRVIGRRTRLLVEKVYQISVADQIIVEEYFENLKEIGPMNHPTILKLCADHNRVFPADCYDYNSRYVVKIPAGYPHNTPL